MTIKRIHSGGDFEQKTGYCRAVVAAGWVHVSGTVGQGDTVEEQCAAALKTIETALTNAGSDFAHVVRVSYFLPNAADFEKCWPQLRAAFDGTPPAATMIECALIDSKYLIEIEVTALVAE